MSSPSARYGTDPGPRSSTAAATASTAFAPTGKTAGPWPGGYSRLEDLRVSLWPRTQRTQLRSQPSPGSSRPLASRSSRSTYARRSRSGGMTSHPSLWRSTSWRQTIERRLLKLATRPNRGPALAGPGPERCPHGGAPLWLTLWRVSSARSPSFPVTREVVPLKRLLSILFVTNW